MSQSRGASFDFVVLPAGPADAEELARVHVTSWRETYRGQLPEAFLARMSEADYVRRFHRSLVAPRPRCVTLAAANAYGLVAYAEAGPSRRKIEDEAEIATLYVLKAAQGRGVGRRLLGSAARALAAEGARSLMISVLASNAPARAFYERLGGQAEAPRAERGPGGLLYDEVAYVWKDIQTLI